MANDYESIQTALIENSDYEEVASVARAKAYVTAAKKWLALVAGSSSNESSSLSLNVSQVHEELKHARAYIAANDRNQSGRGGSVRFLGVGSQFR
jgi:hypothetical protein